jgi:hypothetical protein
MSAYCDNSWSHSPDFNESTEVKLVASEISNAVDVDELPPAHLLKLRACRP